MTGYYYVVGVPELSQSVAADIEVPSGLSPVELPLGYSTMALRSWGHPVCRTKHMHGAYDKVSA